MTRSWTSIAASMALVACTASAQAQGTWTMKAPLPARLNEVSVVSVAGKLHVFGGSVLGFTGPPTNPFYTAPGPGEPSPGPGEPG